MDDMSSKLDSRSYVLHLQTLFQPYPNPPESLASLPPPSSTNSLGSEAGDGDGDSMAIDGDVDVDGVRENLMDLIDSAEVRKREISLLAAWITAFSARHFTANTVRSSQPRPSSTPPPSSSASASPQKRSKAHPHDNESPGANTKSSNLSKAFQQQVLAAQREHIQVRELRSRAHGTSTSPQLVFLNFENATSQTLASYHGAPTSSATPLPPMSPPLPPPPPPLPAPQFEAGDDDDPLTAFYWKFKDITAKAGKEHRRRRIQFMPADDVPGTVRRLVNEWCLLKGELGL